MRPSLAFLAALLLTVSLIGTNRSVAPAQGTVKVLRLSTALSTNDGSVFTVEQIVNRTLKDRTGGKLQIKTYPNSQLGGNAVSIQGIQTGTVDLDIPGSAFLSGLVPQVQALDLPFLFKSSAQAYASIALGPAGETLNKMIASKGTMQNLAWWNIGSRCVSNSKRPVHTPADLKGLKLRTLPSPMQIEVWKRLGAEPTPMDFNEVYSALQQGTIDGQENPLSVIYDAKLYEVQKYISLTNHVFTTTPVLVSEQTMKSLSPSEQQALRDAFKQATQYQWRLIESRVVDNLQSLKKAGLQIDEHPDIPAFKALVTPVYDDLRQKIGTQVLDELLASNDRFEKSTSPSNPRR